MSFRNLTIVCNNAGTQSEIKIDEIPSPTWNVSDLKRHLAERLIALDASNNNNNNVPIDDLVSRIRLIFRGQPLQDTTSLSSIAGLSNDTTVHMLVRPAASASAGSTSTTSSSSNSRGFDTNSLGFDVNNANDIVNQLLGTLGGVAGGMAAGTNNNNNNRGRSNNSGSNSANGDIGSLVSGLLQGVLGGVNAANNSMNNNNNTTTTTTTSTSSSSNNNNNINANTTRTTTFGNTTVRVHDLTGGNSGSTTQQQRRSREETSSGNSNDHQHQQQNQEHNNNNALNVALPPAMVHVHVTPDQLEALPDQLARFYETFSRRTGATSVFNPTNNNNNNFVQFQVENQDGSSSVGNLLGGISRFVSGHTTHHQQEQQANNIQHLSATTTTAATSAPAVKKPYAGVTPARPFVSQSNMAPLKERVSAAVKEVVQRHGVTALLPLINGDWEPLSLFRAPAAAALRQPYMTSASQDSVAAALFGEFEQVAASSVFSTNGGENPLYRAVDAEMGNEDGAAAASSTSTVQLTTTRQVFDRIQSVLQDSMVEALNLILPTVSSASSSSTSTTTTTRWSMQVRNLVVRTAGRVVNVLRNEANLTQDAVTRIVREVANIASPMMSEMNPMMSMLVQSNGPMFIQLWSDEYNLNPENYVNHIAATSSTSSTTATTTTQQQQPITNSTTDNNDADLDDLLDDVLNDFDDNDSQQRPTIQTVAVNANAVGQDSSSTGTDALRVALQQVEGLDMNSIQSILQLTGQALGGNNTSNRGNNNNNGGYFY